MTKDKRNEQIIEYLKANGAASVKELSTLTNVSLITLRNDLDYLAKQNKILRSHGGAVLKGLSSATTTLMNCDLNVLSNIPNRAIKESIVAEAVKLIDPNDSIFIGGGTTFYLMSKLLKTFKDLKVVTTNLSVVTELVGYVDNIYFIGGELVELNGVYYTGGPKLPLELEKVFVNKAFIGVSGIDLTIGLTIYDLSQLNMYQCVPNIARQVILVSDYTKFGFQSAHKIGPVKDLVDIIVTNHQVDERYPRLLKEMGIQLIVD